MQKPYVFQSMWAMQLRSARVPELTTSEAVHKIASGGFDGVSAHWTDRAFVGESKE